MAKSFAKKQADRKVTRDYLGMCDDLRRLRRAAENVVKRHGGGKLDTSPIGAIAIERLREELERQSQ